MKILFTIIIFGIFLPLAFGQYKISGRVTDCSDMLPLVRCCVSAHDGDTSSALIQCDEQGNYSIENLHLGYYRISAVFHYYLITKYVTIQGDTTINLCGTLSEHDTVLYMTPDDLSTIYTFGMPLYEDEELNEVGKQYGVEWINVGCKYNKSYEKHNEMVRKLAARIHGKSWEERFWSEVEKRHKDKK